MTTITSLQGFLDSLGIKSNPLDAAARELAAEADFSEQSLKEMGAGRQSTPNPEQYSARARTTLLAIMARDLKRAEALNEPIYEDYRGNLLGGIVDRGSAILAAESFSPATALQLPLTYANLRRLFVALAARVQQFGVTAPDEWNSFVEGTYDPAAELNAPGTLSGDPA